MRVLGVIFKNTLLISLRKKFLLGILTTCIIILFLSLMFSQLSLDDKGRLTVNFGLAAIQLLLVAISIFFGSGLISNDLGKKIMWTILVRPVRPSTFFFGRYLGLAFLLFLTLVILSFVLVLFFIFLKIPIQLVLFYALLGFLLESCLILAFVLFFSSYVQNYLVLFYCLSVFIICHFLDSLFYFIEKSSNLFSQICYRILQFIPNLERVNWKSSVVYQDKIAFSEVAFSSLYMCLWIAFILSLSFLFMEKREYM